jgi:hypothetical protein
VLAWVEFTTGAELDELERLARVAADERPLFDAEEAQWLAIYAAALSRQLAGWPDHCADPDRYRAGHPRLPEAYATCSDAYAPRRVPQPALVAAGGRR